MNRDKALNLLHGGETGIQEWNRRRETGEEIPDLSEAKFEHCDLQRVNLQGAILRGATIEYSHLHHANLSHADLSGARAEASGFHPGILHSAKFRRAHLQEVSFNQADLSQADFQGADITGCVFDYSRLQGTDFRTALLTFTTLNGGGLSGAKLAGARLWECAIACDLSEAEGVNDIICIGPSDIAVRTILGFEKELPEKFLRGCGLRDEEIEYFRAVVGEPIRFYSCFISYCTADEAFATRLHNDFQKAGIRCYKWNYDARTGEAMFGEISQAIRKHDKMLLIASEHSLTSAPVNREIERAIQEEDRRAKLVDEGKWKGVPTVLFPVRLDDYIFEEDADGQPKWDHPRRADVRERVIADGVGWEKDIEKYEAVRDRLIRDLKPPAT